MPKPRHKRSINPTGRGGALKSDLTGSNYDLINFQPSRTLRGQKSNFWALLNHLDELVPATKFLFQLMGIIYAKEILNHKFSE